MSKTIKEISISNEQDICDLGEWLRGLIHEYRQMPRRTLYTAAEELPPAIFNVEVRITRQVNNGTSAQR